MRYIGGVAGATVLSALMRDASSPASHQRPVLVYAGALVVAAGLSLLLPGRIARDTEASSSASMGSPPRTRRTQSDPK
jgi:hypothetical protein